MRDPAITVSPFIDITDSREWHVKTHDKKLVGREHVQNPLSCCDRLVLVVIHLEIPLGALHCHYVLSARVGSDHDTFAVALDMKCQQAWRMSGSVDRSDARHDFVARLDEA